MLEILPPTLDFKPRAVAYHDGRERCNTQIRVAPPDESHGLHRQRLKQASRFLNIPVEIRLRIYEELLLLHPLQPAELSPGYPTPRHRPYIVEPVVPNATSDSRSSARTITQTDGTPSTPNSQRPALLLSPHRPAAFLPAALLRTCRQVYAEARTVPFHQNEFVFPAFFSSGMTAAHAFLARLAPWQRAAMRFVRLEVRVRDLCDPTAVHRWEEVLRGDSGGVFGAVSGLQGLRLTVSVEDYWGAEGPPGREVWGSPRMDGAASWRWVDSGLALLGGLRALEVELAGEMMGSLGDEGKIKWCEELSERLNRGRGPRERTAVLCVAKRKAKGREDERGGSGAAEGERAGSEGSAGA